MLALTRGALSAGVIKPRESAIATRNAPATRADFH
jgi:hypothetical protein